MEQSQAANYNAPSTVTTTTVETEEENMCHGLWIYPEILDVIALVAALCLGVATASLFAFSYDEIKKADEAYVAHHADSFSFMIKSIDSHPVSKGLMVYGFLSSSLSSFSLILAVAVRILLSYVTRMKLRSRKRQYVLKWANPMAVLVLLTWAASAILTAPTLYFIAWVVFPEEIAASKLIVALGGIMWTADFLLFCLAIHVARVARRIGAEEDKEEEETSKIQHQSGPQSSRNNAFSSLQTNQPGTGQQSKELDIFLEGSSKVEDSNRESQTDEGEEAQEEESTKRLGLGEISSTMSK